MPTKRAKDSGKENNPLVAIITAGLCLAFVVFVFVYDDLKKDPYVQGLTAILVALAIAIVLFSAVPGSKATFRLPLGLAGAAAFYIILLPQIKSFVFPLYTYTGYVEFECDKPPGKDFFPVQDAEVAVKDSDLKASTNEQGKFTIPNVPSQITITELLISRGGNSYRLNVKENPDNVFHIPPEPAIVDSPVKSIDVAEWTEDNNTCTSGDGDKNYFAIRQVILNKSVPTEAGYSTLLVEVAAPEGVEIAGARKLAPPEGNKVQAEQGYAKLQKWQIPVNANETALRLSVCLGSTKRDVKISDASLTTRYWFQKVEAKKCPK